MKKFCLSLVCLALVALVAAPAWAIPPFNDAFKKAYVKDGTPLADKVAAEKCNVCHMGKEKKDKNEFGKVVGKYLKKADFTGDNKKYDPKSDEGQKAMAEGLEKALAEKSAGGKTYGELIKEGELPGTVK
jgi:hypothetical protein